MRANLASTSMAEESALRTASSMEGDANRFRQEGKVRCHRLMAVERICFPTREAKCPRRAQRSTRP